MIDDLGLHLRREFAGEKIVPADLITIRLRREGLAGSLVFPQDDFDFMPQPCQNSTPRGIDRADR